MKPFFKSFVYAVNGLLYALRTQRNLKIHFLVGTMVIVAGFYFSLSAQEWLAAILCMGMVTGMELMNTAVEEMVNFIAPGFDEKAGRIKDIAAGAVLVTAIIAAISGCIIFIPKIFNLFN